MRSIRVYKVLMPGVLVVFVVLLVLQLKPVEGVHSDVTDASGLQVGTSVDGVRAVDFDGDRKNMEIHAGSIQRGENDRITLDRIHELKLHREDRLPLILQALSGDIEGDRGARTMNFRDGVTLEDPEKGVRVRIPDLLVEEATQEARAEGRVVVEGDIVSGTGDRLIYRFDGRPAELSNPTFRDDTDATLAAAHATLFDGFDDVELEGEVRARRGDEFLDAEQLRIKRVNDVPVHATASGDVLGAARLRESGLVEFAGDSVDIRFDDGGQPRLVAIEGSARVGHATESVSAGTITMRRLTPEGDWRFSGRRGVVIEGLSPEGPGLLRAERIDAVLDRNGDLIDATSTGGVSFDARSTRAEASRATFTTGVVGEIRLFGTGRRKARLARQQTRVAAEEISLTANGSGLFAERGVEATLLADDRQEPIATGPFVAAEAVHFVSQTLLGSEGGGRLVFEGDVRAWQGERNLSADRITLDQQAQTLLAEQDVATRLPRKPGIGASQADFIQIGAARLEYSNEAAVGVFSDGVRVTLSEGWLDADSVEFETDPTGGGLAEIRAAGSVRFEFREIQRDGESPEIVTGSADRLVYDPVEETVRLIGDDAPATVRRIGEGRGTTSGRVLRYHLQTGALEVESGSIQTGS